MVNEKLIATLGYEPHTPLDEAVGAALIGMACLATGGKEILTSESATPDTAISS
jgi:hypothetical protein